MQSQLTPASRMHPARASASPRQSLLRSAAPARTRRVCVAASKDGYKVLIVGGGSAGATVASHYARKMPGQVAVIEPSKFHYYQPLWTLVGGGFKDVQDSVRPMKDVMPAGVDWLQTSVTEFNPNNDRLTTSDGRTIKYDYLVVATGIQAKWERVKGLPAALGDGHVTSNMNFRTAPLTFKTLQEVAKMDKGSAVFTMPKGVIKCPGAGQKVCYISEDYLRRQGKRPAINVTLCLAADRVFGIPRYAETIKEVVRERDIKVELNTNLVEVRADKQQAIFDILGQDGQTIGQESMHYDMLHVTPPQGPFDVVAKSALANADGWVAINPETMQHTRFPNVFSLGDCAAVSTSKTAAAAAAQFLVLRDNMDALIDGVSSHEPALYDGYSSCPLVTKKGACMMMEFGYNGQILETFTPLGIVDQQKEEWLMWLVKTEVLPFAYWSFMSKGYVPWSEVKNAIKKITKAIEARGAAPPAAQGSSYAAVAGEAKNAIKQLTKSIQARRAA